MIQVKRLAAQEFVSDVVPRLVAREAAHNLVISLAYRVLGQAEAQSNAVFSVLEEHGRFAGAAVRTPPQFVVVTDLRPGGAEALAEFFRDLGDVPDGATGPDAHGRDLALALAAPRRAPIEHVSDELVYELTEVRPPAPPPGAPRPATHEDVPRLTGFFAGFFREVRLPHAPDPGVLAAMVVERGTGLVWEDGEPCSIACSPRKTATGASIGPVYTPPEARGRGYASALTAELAQRLLDDGRRFVCLHAERKNRTSNHIYRSIGFREVGTMNVWAVR